MIKLVGECNRCGLCCYDAAGAKCLNLEVISTPGQPNATRCRVYNKRYDGMPIVLQHQESGELIGGVCRLDSIDETLAIINSGIGKGCSLEVVAESEAKHYP